MRFGASFKKWSQCLLYNNQNEWGWFVEPKVNVFSSYLYPVTLVPFSPYFAEVISEAFQNAAKSSSSMLSEWAIFKYSSFQFQPSRRQKSTDLFPLLHSYLNLLLYHILSLMANFQELTCGFENSIFHSRLY